jgi:hypothetical protein
MGNFSKKGSAIPYQVSQACIFEGIKVRMLNEIDTINLYHIYFGTELNPVYLLAPDNGTNIGL